MSKPRLKVVAAVSLRLTNSRATRAISRSGGSLFRGQAVHKIKITGGAFPKQSASVLSGRLTLRGSDRSYVRYRLRAAIADIQKISDGLTTITYQITLSDGKAIVCTSKKKTYNYLHAEKATGQQPQDVSAETLGGMRAFRARLQRGATVCVLILLAVYIGVAFNHAAVIDPATQRQENLIKAQKICQAVHNTEEGMEYRIMCTVDEANQTINVRMSTSIHEAKLMCWGIADEAYKNALDFNKTWTLKILPSLKSGGTPLMTCKI